MIIKSVKISFILPDGWDDEKRKKALLQLGSWKMMVEDFVDDKNKESLPSPGEFGDEEWKYFITDIRDEIKVEVEEVDSGV